MYKSKRITKAVIDTGPLFTALTLDFIERNKELGEFLGRYQLPEYLKTDLILQKAYRNFFKGIDRFLISSHTVGELRSRYRIPSMIQHQFIECAMYYLKCRRLDERIISILTIENDAVHRQLACRYGFIDAGAIKLAREEKCVFLTDDSRLYPCLNNTGPEIELLSNVVFVE